MYYMSYFFDEDQTLRIAAGNDLLHFTPLNHGKPVLDLRPQGKIIRDPYILKDQNHTYQLFFTDNWNSNTLGHSTSEDLIHWKEPEYIPVMGNNNDTANCWAPELCFDPEKKCLYAVLVLKFLFSE